MNIDALKYMIEMLKGIKEQGKKFDLREWVIMDKEHPVCGTSCCAMGYAALDPVFQLAGLSMYAYIYLADNDDMTNKILLKTTEDFNKVAKQYYDRQVMYDFTYKNDEIESGFSAAVKLFDFENEETAEILFLQSSYLDEPNEGSIDEIIERIEYLIKFGEENFLIDFG